MLRCMLERRAAELRSAPSSVGRPRPSDELVALCLSVVELIHLSSALPSVAADGAAPPGEDGAKSCGRVSVEPTRHKTHMRKMRIEDARERLPAPADADDDHLRAQDATEVCAMRQLDSCATADVHSLGSGSPIQ